MTKEEKALHYRGHFARLRVQPADNGKWTITSEKIDVPLEKHPQKERPRSRHPNWGHPVLRAVEKKKAFPTMDIARAQLQSLHMEYPDATIPGKDVLHVMVYSRKENTGGDSSSNAPIEKISIKAKPHSDGSAKLMQYKKRIRKTLPDWQKASADVSPEQPLGEERKFTTLVKKKRSKK